MDHDGSGRRDHAIFKAYPLDAEVTVAGEVRTSPYHVYDGSVLFLAGTADARATADLLSGEGLGPILDAEGRALAALWAADFTEANLGPHRELQVSLFATARPVPPVAAHPFAVLRALTSIPEARMVCHGLWNDADRVVAYNREHLGLDARRAVGAIERTPDRVRFRFSEPDGTAIATGDLAATVVQPPGPMFRMLGHIGLKAVWRGIREPFVRVPVVNTRGPLAAENRVAWTYTKGDRQVIRDFGPGDRVAIDHPRYAPLDFRPEFVQDLSGVRFVYLRPEADGG